MDKTDSYNVTAEADQAHDDQWLANQIVALGVGSKCKLGLYDLFPGSRPFTYTEFVRDWRVAGAMMEKMTAASMLRVFGPIGARVRPSARAINEACVEALS